ncbi:MAG: hypothetical protein NTW52_15945, partial [Planctomycetota bacterium]|nr:hypothetical protein [Planctomycetota bacterium]
MKKSKLLSWVGQLHRWIQPKARPWFRVPKPWRAGQTVNNHGFLEFRKLERRRVYAVDAFFVNGELSIEISGTTQHTANLLSTGTDFFVDENNDFVHDSNEVRGLISEIDSISVIAKDNQGFFYWGGNFSAAPLSISSTNNSVSILNVQEAYLEATFHAKNDVIVYANDSIKLDKEIVVDGNFALGVGVAGTISDQANAVVRVHGDLTLNSGVQLVLADELTNSWQIDGATNLFSTGPISLGDLGKWDSASFSAIGSELTVQEFNQIDLAALSISGSASIFTPEAITDTSGADISIGGELVLSGKLISLADDSFDKLIVFGATSITASTGDITIQQDGLVQLGDITATGANISIYEDDSTSLTGITAIGNLLIESSGAITDNSDTSIIATSSGFFQGSTILLADGLNNVISIGGPVNFVATSGAMLLDTAGTVSLANVSASGTNVTIYEDASITLVNIYATGNLVLHSSGMIGDSPDAFLVASGTALITGTSISLANSVNDTVSVGGLANFIATSGSILIDNTGTVSLADISASGVNITIYEDASTSLRNINATGNLFIQSSGVIGDNINASIVASGSGTFHGSSISLSETANDTLTIAGSVNFIATLGSVTISNSGTVTLGDISARGSSITLCEDSSSILGEVNANGNLLIQSDGDINDTLNGSITATGTGSFHGASVTLSDNTTDILAIDGAVGFTATSGVVSINALGTVTLGDVSASGTDITIFEDASTALVNISATGNLLVQSSGSVTDNPNASIIATGTGSFTGTSITLSENAADVLNIGGAVGFTATSGVVSINALGTVTLGDVSASGTDITVFEDASTALVNISATGNLLVQSTGAITDNPSASIIATGTSSFTG